MQKMRQDDAFNGMRRCAGDLQVGICRGAHAGPGWLFFPQGEEGDQETPACFGSHRDASFANEVSVSGQPDCCNYSWRCPRMKSL